MKVKTIDTIRPRFIPKIHTKSWNVSFKVIDEEDYYKFYVSNSIADNSLYHPRQYEYGGFSIEDINQIVPDSKSVTNKMDKAYTDNYIREVDTNYRLYTKPMEVAINRG